MASNKTPGAGERQNPESSVYVVTEREVAGRVQLILAGAGDRLRKCDPKTQGYSNLGTYHVVDDRNVVVYSPVNFESFARDLGALQPYERMEG
jgi:hypothetical protein